MTIPDEFFNKSLKTSQNTFELCVNLIVYAYLNLVASGKTYSRSQIEQIVGVVKKRKLVKRLPLEDYLRNDLVKTFVDPNKHLFDLDLYSFVPGVEEQNGNVATGILDIKVFSPLLDNSYFIFECKRVNHQLLDKYVAEGIVRFVNRQYYPKGNISLAGMIAFLESSESKHEITVNISFDIFEELLNRFRHQVNFQGSLTRKTLNCDRKQVKKFNSVYESTHGRTGGPINIFHLVFDYNNIVVQ
ncbi:MAG: hypothetical protein KF687_15730 [Cyclobacteriaceae bacterium]|nr:hypothetical protein [Cyclobacteriaceae bacterium]